MAEHPTNDRIDLVSGSFWGRNPHEELTWMRQNAPVYHDPNSGVWGIAGYHEIKEVSKHPELFSNAGGIRPANGPLPMMIDMDDPAHWARRKLINKGFTPKRVREQEDYLRQTCDAIIDDVCERGECDFVWDIAAWLPLIVIGDALGVEPTDRPDLMRWSDDMLRGLVGLDNEDAMVKAAEAFVGYTEYAARVVEDRQKCPRDDLMSVFVHAEVDGEKLSPDAIVHESLLVLIGGDETTRHVISGGAFQLMADPDQRQKLIDDPAKIPTAVEEMLRWVTPIKNMARTVTGDVDFHGQKLAKGDELLLLYPSANRDERVFDDPFRFDVERTPNEHVAFGFGAHFCLGQALARLELRVMFEQLLKRLPDLAIAGDAEPAYRPANFVSGYEGMKVTFTPTAKVGAATA
jgi:cytochrome P450 family 142 subfamily A polypeptide 1